MTEIIKSIIERVTRYEWFTIFMPGIFFVLIGKSFEMSIIEVKGGWSLLFAAALWGYVSYATEKADIQIARMCVEYRNQGVRPVDFDGIADGCDCVSWQG